MVNILKPFPVFFLLKFSFKSCNFVRIIQSFLWIVAILFDSKDSF